MAGLSRSQLAAYGAVAIAVLLLGARWIHSQPGEAPRRFENAPLKVSDQGSGDVVVHVAGQVAKPGVYRLPAGSRVTDAVDRAGGTAPGAAADGINLAARLSDGQQVVVPSRTARSAAGDAAPDGPISLGSATLEQLDSIEGIGPVTAQKILDFRTQHGGISSVAELDRVSGIGPATMETLKGRLQP
jgi:competence protein ComEA